MVKKIVLCVVILCVTDYSAWGANGANQSTVQNVLDEIAPAVLKGEIQRAVDYVGDRMNIQDAEGNSLVGVLAGSRVYTRGYKVQLIKALLSKGADAVTVNRWGESPLLRAITEGDVEIVQLLLDNKNVLATIDNKDPVGNTPLIMTIMLDKSNDLKIRMIRELLARGASAGTTNAKGLTPLLFSVERGDADIATTLLENKDILATIDWGDKEGKTALFKAVEKKSAPMVQLLIGKGARRDVGLKIDGMTPLMLAAQDNWLEGIPLIVDSNSINLTDKKGKTALMYASQQLNWDTIKLLENKGAGMMIKDAQGRDAFAHAVSRCPLACANDDIVGRVMENKIYGWEGRHQELAVCSATETFCIGSQCGFRCQKREVKVLHVQRGLSKVYQLGDKFEG